MRTGSQITPFSSVLAGIFFLCFSLSVIGQVENQNLQYPNSEVDFETAKATVKAYESGNWDDLRSFLKEDAKIFGLGNYDSLNVDQTINYWTKGRETAIPSLSEEGQWLAVSNSEGPQEGNWIYHWGVNTLTYNNGEKVTFPYHVALKIEDKKVAESHFYYDNMKIIRAMGYAISPPVQETTENLEVIID